MPRFFVKREDIYDGSARICGDDAFHIARSLRMAEGDEITLCDGEGKELLCSLERIRDEECICRIIEVRECETESPVSITLCMAYPKGDKLETVIQKAVELGATKIIPYESSRCIKRPKAEKQEKQTARLERIAEEAAKQCGRGRLPTVTPPMTFEQMLKEASSSALSFICYEDEDKLCIKNELEKSERPESISVIVGSEGGFSPEEVERAKSYGIKSVTLGKRILRCETAPSFALSAISYRFEL